MWIKKGALKIGVPKGCVVLCSKLCVLDASGVPCVHGERVEETSLFLVGSGGGHDFLSGADSQCILVSRLCHAVG